MIIIFSHFHYHVLHICTLTSPFLIYKNGIMHAERQGKGSSFTLMWLVWWKEAIILIKTEKTPCWHLQSHTHLLSPRSIWLLCLVLINLPFFLSTLSLSISLSLPDHFTLLSSSPLSTGPHLCLVFSLQPFLFSHHLLLSTFMTLWVFVPLLSPISLYSIPPRQYLSFAGGEDLKRLDLFLLTIPGNCLWVQHAGYHRILLHLWTRWWWWWHSKRELDQT